jgi:hypothetical protein
MSGSANDQERLERTLRMAWAGEDRELAARVRESGEGLVRQLYGAVRMTRLHALDNAAYDKPIHELVDTLARLLDLLGAVHLVAVEDQVYVNDIRVRLDPRTDLGRLLGEELRRHRVGGMTFHALPTSEELRALVALFARQPDPRRPRQVLQQVLVAKRIDCIELTGVFRYRTSGERINVPRADSMRVAGRAAVLVDAAFENLGANRIPNPLPIRRAVTDILEAGTGDVGLWQEQDAVSAYSAHTLRAALVSMLIGRALGLSDEALQDLGVAAMFHDVGYAAREGASSLDGEDDQELAGYPPPFERHPSAGARLLLRQRGFHAAKINRVLATLHHHRDLDDQRGKPVLFGRILRIAEAYDNLQRPDGGGRTPPDALRCLMRYAGSRYDPLLVQLLVNVLGCYPPGTLLQLEDGRVVRSRSVTRNLATFDRPLCELVRRANGGTPTTQELVDLAVEGRVEAEMS